MRTTSTAVVAEWKHQLRSINMFDRGQCQIPWLKSRVVKCRDLRRWEASLLEPGADLELETPNALNDISITL